MKRFLMLKAGLLAVWVLQMAPPAFSEGALSEPVSDRPVSVFSSERVLPEVSSAAASSEKEYEDVTVVLIDPKTGALGVVYTDEITGKQEKKAFLVNLNEIDIFNPLNQELEFFNIEVGHQLDIFTQAGLEGGEEKVVEILDHSYVEKE